MLGLSITGQLLSQMSPLPIAGRRGERGGETQQCMRAVCQRLWLPYETGGCPRRFLPRCGFQRREGARGQGRLRGCHGGPGASAPALPAAGRVSRLSPPPGGGSSGLVFQSWRERAWTYRERREGRGEGSPLGAVTGGGRPAAPAACGSTGAVTGGWQEPGAEEGIHPSVS